MGSEYLPGTETDEDTTSPTATRTLTVILHAAREHFHTWPCSFKGHPAVKLYVTTDAAKRLFPKIVMMRLLQTQNKWLMEVVTGIQSTFEMKMPVFLILTP
jgi:hypothetical protein